MDAVLSDLDWSLVQAFLSVAEEGSLSAAARRMGASQPTLGRQIKTMEVQLGARLFDRRPRGFELTSTGAALVPAARAMEQAARRIALTAAGTEDRLEGPVRITASVAISIYHLPEIIAGIRREEPRISIDLVPSDESRNLLYREADIAVRMYRPQQLDLVTQYLGEVRLGLFAAHSYLDRHGRPDNPEALMQHDFVGYDANPLIIEGFAAAGFAVSRDWFPVRCDDNGAYWELVRAGCGIGFAQHKVGLADPAVEEIALPLDLPTLPVWLTAHEAMRRTPRIRRIWDLLAEGLRPLVS